MVLATFHIMTPYRVCPMPCFSGGRMSEIKVVEATSMGP